MTDGRNSPRGRRPTKAATATSRGARPLARAIERLVTRPLSEKLIAGAFQPGDKVSVVAARGEVVLAQ